MSLNLYSLIASLPLLPKESTCEKSFLMECKQALNQKEFERLTQCTIQSTADINEALSKWQKQRDLLKKQINYLRSKKYNIAYQKSPEHHPDQKLIAVFEQADPLKFNDFIFERHLNIINELQENFQFTFNWLVYYYLKLQLYEIKKESLSCDISVDQILNVEVQEYQHD